MAKLIEQNKEKQVKPVDHKTFLATLTKQNGNGELLYPNGIEVGVEKVIGPRITKGFDGNPQTQMIIILSIIDDLDGGIVGYKLDDDGKKITTVNELGENVPSFTSYQREDEGVNEIAFFMKVNTGDEEVVNDVDCDITVYPKSACFSLFNTALEDYGLLNNPKKGAFQCSTEEIKECLEGFTFMAGCEFDSFKGGNKYRKLVVKSIVE